MNKDNFMGDRLNKQSAKIVEKYYKEEVIKEIFDSFEDKYKCNEYILITHKSVSKAINRITLERIKDKLGKLGKFSNTYIPITTVMDKQETKESICDKIFIQMQKLFNEDMTCGFYNTVKREFETDQDKINILQMITEGSLEIDEAEFRNRYDKSRFSEIDFIWYT